MDPDAVLTAAINAARDGDAVTCAFSCLDLLRWLAKGGTKPSAFSTRLDSLERHLDKLDVGDDDEEEDDDDE